MKIPKDHALIIDAAGNVAIVPRSAVTGEATASITVPEHQLDEALERVMRLLSENNDKE
jgi:hypothetical protein